jgi:hypothetical protein
VRSVLAYFSRKADAVREGETGVAFMPIMKDAFLGTYIQHQLVTYTSRWVSPKKRSTSSSPCSRFPIGFRPAGPNFDPLRGNPRFQRLVNGS